MGDPVERVVSRLNRGEELLHEVKDEVNAFLRVMPFEPALEVDRKGRVVVRATHVRAPPDRLSIRVGECVYAYRSALEHLAYQLTARHSGEPLEEGLARNSAFPIMPSGPRFRRFGLPKLRGMSPAARRTVERMQPYHRRRLPEAGVLLALEQLWNIDKHRDLHPTGSALAGTQLGISGTGFFRLDAIEVFAGELRERALLARFSGEFDYDGELEFSMPNGRFDVVFGRECAAPKVRGQSVLGTLVDAREFLLKTLMPAFAEVLDVDFGVNEGDWH